MKKIIFHSSLLWVASIALSLTVRAQKIRSMSIIDDSSSRPVRTVIICKDGPLYNITLVEDKVLELSVDGRKVPADSFYVYDALIKRIVVQMKRDRVQAKLDQEQAMKDQVQAERDQVQAMRDQVQSAKDQQQAVRDKMQAERDQDQGGQDRIQAQKDKQQAERDQAQAQRDKMQAERDQQQAVRDREQAQRDIKFAEEDKVLLKGLIGEVIKDGLAPDEKSVGSVYLDEYEFVLNGKKQSGEIFTKYKGKFLGGRHSTISFHR